MRFALWLLRQLCSMIDHRGPALNYAMDEGGNWMISDCRRCRTVTFTAIHNDQPMEPAVIADMLDEWFQ